MDNKHIVIGIHEHWGQTLPVILAHNDRRQHLYTIGKSGAGKTTLLRNLILQDIEAGHGVGVIDPHGDLATDLLDHIPRHRIEDVVYFNPSDVEYPIGLNLLGAVPAENRHLVASGIVSVFKSIWREFFGPRMEYILYATVAALLECQNVSLLGVQRMLSDARYRAWVVKQVKDPIVRSFWVNEFENYDSKFLQEAIAPIQNKVGQLLMSPHLRNILGQVKSKIDARFIMDRGRIFIADVSKGKLGADKSNLIGALLVTQFQLAAMSRADVPEHERRDFFLYVDEFQSFASDSFVSILSEARKYRLCLTLSHQYVEQLKPEKGNQHHGFCPLPNHNGKKNSPSFSANLEKGIFQCFGCGAKGNILDFAAMMENADPKDGAALHAVAVELQRWFCPELGNKPKEKTAAKKVLPKAEPKNELPVLINEPLNFDLKGLDAKHPYLLNRGFTPETIERFGLGFCSRGFFKDRVAIPLHRHDGQLVGYAGRVVDDSTITEDNPRYKLPGSRERDGKILEFRKTLFVYNGFRVKAPVDDLIVVEGFTSVWWLNQNGLPNVVSIMGADCSERQAELIVSLVKPVGRVWLMPDGNEAGERCAQSVLLKVSPHGFVRWAKLGADKQPTDLSGEQLKNSFTT